MSDHLPDRERDHQLVRKNQRLGFMVMGIVAGMLLLSFASVPLYNLFCRVTGFGGKPYQGTAASGEIVDRELTVRFNTDVNPNLDWKFEAEQTNLTLKIGQEALISYKATNQSTEPLAGTAIYNVLPPAAGKYFHKTQCFCFNYQLIAPGQSAHFPVVFYIDPALAQDPDLADLKTITLSYTFFKADSNELESALEAFYKDGKSGNKSVPLP